MHFEETLELVSAYGMLREEIGKQTDELRRNARIVEAADLIADYIAAVMANKTVDNQTTV